MKRSRRAAGFIIVLVSAAAAYGWIANYTEITRPYFIVFLAVIGAAIILLKK